MQPSPSPAMSRTLDHHVILDSRLVGPAVCDAGSAGHDAGDGRQRARRRSKLVARNYCRLAREITGAVFAVPIAAIEKPTRATIKASDARHAAMYIAHVVFQVSLAAMAGEFGRDRSSVTYAVRRIEDERDDPGFDATIERIERLAHAVRQAMDAPSIDQPGGRTGVRTENGSRS